MSYTSKKTIDLVWDCLKFSIKGILKILGIVFILVLIANHFYPPYEKSYSKQLTSIDSTMLFEQGKWVGRNAVIQYVSATADSTITIDMKHILRMETELAKNTTYGNRKK